MLTGKIDKQPDIERIMGNEVAEEVLLKRFRFGFLFNEVSTFAGYLIPKLSWKKNRSCTIETIAAGV